MEPSTKTESEILVEFAELKTTIIEKCPSTTISFITVPPANIRDYNSRNYSRNIFDEETVSNMQKNHVNVVQKINSGLRNLNQSTYTVDWAEKIMKKHKKRCGRNRYLKEFYRFHFNNLYDGLHAISDLKHVWFNNLLLGFRRELRKSNLK